MTQNLVEQLDLNIYSSPFSFSWNNPLVLASLILSCSALVVTVWFVKRRFRKKIIIPFSVIAIRLLKKWREELVEEQIDVSQAALLLTTILKSYTAWLTQNEIVKGMTDQQWLVFIKRVKLFEPYYDDCSAIIETVNQLKFNYAQLSREQVLLLFEKALHMVVRMQANDSK